MQHSSFCQTWRPCPVHELTCSTALVELCVQVGTKGIIASFDSQESMGRVGVASTRPAAQRNAVQELMLGDQDLKQAAEVILGRLDIADLVGGANVQQKAAAVCAIAAITCCSVQPRTYVWKLLVSGKSIHAACKGCLRHAV
jgi:hypothetical protein